MAGHVVVGHVGVALFQQHLTVRRDQDGAERMGAVFQRAAGDVEAFAQQGEIVERHGVIQTEMKRC